MAHVFSVVEKTVIKTPRSPIRLVEIKSLFFEISILHLKKKRKFIRLSHSYISGWWLLCNSPAASLSSACFSFGKSPEIIHSCIVWKSSREMSPSLTRSCMGHSKSRVLWYFSAASKSQLIIAACISSKPSDAIILLCSSFML